MLVLFDVACNVDLLKGHAQVFSEGLVVHRVALDETFLHVGKLLNDLLEDVARMMAGMREPLCHANDTAKITQHRLVKEVTLAVTRMLLDVIHACVQVFDGESQHVREE